MHELINLDEFREAQKIAAHDGVDPRNSADRIWDAHALLVEYNNSEYDANRALSGLLRRQAG